MPFNKAVAVDNPFYALGNMHKIARGISGHLVEEEGNVVCIPAFYSLTAGKGHTGQFIDALKEKYSIVKFPSIINPVLEGMLQRRGFKKKREYVSVLKGHVDVYIWRGN
jgi:hypothetical protein